MSTQSNIIGIPADDPPFWDKAYFGERELPAPDIGRMAWEHD